MTTTYSTTYQGVRRSAADHQVTVVFSGGPGSHPVILPLPHHVKHSPGGFSWGYHGSGPAELARCLLAHALDVSADQVDPGDYQAFKRAHVANWTGDSWAITRDEVLDWFRGYRLLALLEEAAAE